LSNALNICDGIGKLKMSRSISSRSAAPP